MASEKNTLTELINSPYTKLIGTAVVIGLAWGRMETRYSQTEDRIIKKIDEHILSDGFEKQAMNKEISELKHTIQTMQDEAKEYFKTEFVRPDEIRIEPSKRNRR